MNKEYVKKNYEEASKTLFMGQYVTEFSKEELVVALWMIGGQYSNALKQHQQDLDLLA